MPIDIQVLGNLLVSLFEPVARGVLGAPLANTLFGFLGQALSAVGFGFGGW